MNLKFNRILLLPVLFLIFAVFSCTGYTLADRDYRSSVSPSSTRGKIINVAGSFLTLLGEDRDNAKCDNQRIRLSAKTYIFTELGKELHPRDLKPGQYIWVWYRTHRVKKAAGHPEAATMIVWSKDPQNQPSDTDKKAYDGKG